MNGGGLTCFAAPQFVPLIIGKPIAVDILHHPHDPWFIGRIKGIALNRKIISALILNAVVKSYYDVTAKGAERYITLLGSIFDGRFSGRFATGKTASIDFVDELPGSRRIFIHSVGIG